MNTAPHPAKFSKPMIPLFREQLHRLGPEHHRVLDPFAGTGKIHELYPEFETYGIEIEPRWASAHPRTWIGNALHLPLFWTNTFDAVVTSPTYGNRMADHHNAKDGSKRLTYRHQYGENLQPDNSGTLQWGKDYMRFHLNAWKEVWRVIMPGGMFILNVSNHIRKQEVIQVSEWHVKVIKGLGFVFDTTIVVPTARMGFGANRLVRVDHEDVHVFFKPNPKEAA